MSATWPNFSEEIILKVTDILRSGNVNYWTGGEGKSFEKEYSNFCGTKYAVALANGTVALEVALKALNIKPGDEVLVTPRTFFATVSVICRSGAAPVFIDVDRETQNIDSTKLEEKITKKTKAILCVHLAGWPCDMDQILSIARRHNLFVIEDCAQAHGAKYKGRSVGSIGDVGCWSFCQDKIISTGGEGGMITTNNHDIWSKIWSEKDHGKNYHLSKSRQASADFKWLHESFGSNYRMSEIQAAIGRIQLKELNVTCQLRRANVSKIWDVASQLPGIRTPKLQHHSCGEFCDQEGGCDFAAYKCYVFVEGGREIRNQVLHRMRERAVKCYSGSCPEVYLEKAFEGLGFRPPERLPVAKELGETSIMLLCDPSISENDLSHATDALCKTVRELGL